MTIPMDAREHLLYNASTSRDIELQDMSQPGSPRQREAQPIKSDPLLHEGRTPHREPSAGRAGTFVLLPQCVGAWLLHELRRALPPTIFFFVGFNFIVLTTNLLVADYAAAVSNFMLLSLAALVVGKAVITPNAIPFMTRLDRVPLIQPILLKTLLYKAIFLGAA